MDLNVSVLIHLTVSSGGLKRFRAYTSHRFHGKTKKQRRHLRKASMVHAGDFKRIKAMLTRLK